MPAKKQEPMVEVVRSFSRKLNLARYGMPYETADFFCSQKMTCPPAEADGASRSAISFAMKQVDIDVKDFQKDLAGRRDLQAEAEAIDTGGAPVGTVAAQQAVAERKLAALKAEAARPKVQSLNDAVMEVQEAIQEAKPVKPQNFIAKTVAALTPFKAQLGEATYYRILSKYGVTHSNQFREETRDAALACWKELKALAATGARAGVPEKPPPPPTPKQQKDDPALANLLFLSSKGAEWGWSNNAIHELGEVFKARKHSQALLTVGEIAQGCAAIGGPQELKRDQTTDDAYRLMLIAKITPQWVRIPALASASSTAIPVLLDAIQEDCTTPLELLTREEIESVITRFEKGPNL